MAHELSAIPAWFWTKVVDGSLDTDFEFLALKISLSRLRTNARKGSTDAAGAARELQAFFTNYQLIPQAQADLQKLLEKAGIAK